MRCVVVRSESEIDRLDIMPSSSFISSKPMVSQVENVSIEMSARVAQRTAVTCASARVLGSRPVVSDASSMSSNKDCHRCSKDSMASSPLVRTDRKSSSNDASRSWM